MVRTLIVIPARYHSTRLPKKLLKKIRGKSILQHVYERCIESELVTKVIVATDHKVIYDHCAEQNLDVIMTSDHHTSGTDRVAEALNLLKGSFDLVINVQGDEPLISEKQINSLISLMNSKGAEIGTLYKTKPRASINNPNEVKLVCSMKNKVLYFSRNTIPFDRDGGNTDSVKHHIGMYAFRPTALKNITQLLPTTLEESEKLEQLRWLENGYEVYANEVEYEGFGIDVEEDYQRAKLIMESNAK